MVSSSFWNGKRVLLTGHTGFKGTWCALWLERLGAVVHGLALPPDGSPSIWLQAGRPAEHEGFGDIRDPERVAKAFQYSRPDIVIHMAAQALVHSSYEKPVETFEINVMGLVQVLEIARQTSSVRAIVNVTSDKCYENNEQIWAYRETEPMGGSDPYSASKGCAELITASYRRSFFRAPEGPQLASGRAGNVIGGGDWSANRLLPDCVRAFARSEPVRVRNPLATRPWQHVLEPISGYLALGQALYEKGAEFSEGWNFGPPDSDAVTVGHVVERFSDLWAENARWERDESAWPKEAMLLRVDATKARHRLGWRPRLSVDDALWWTVEWYKLIRDGRPAAQVTMDQIARYEDLAQLKERPL